MQINLLTQSNTLKKHINKMDLGYIDFKLIGEVSEIANKKSVVLVHSNSIINCRDVVAKLKENKNIYVGVGSDMPNMHDFLELSAWDINCYFNSYMAKVHYQQMIEMVLAGQKWIVPEVLASTLALAIKAEKQTENSFSQSEAFNLLTKKEKQIANFIGDCLSNKAIAKKQNITERTVKAHLTKIYKKLNIKDRITLAAKLNK